MVLIVSLRQWSWSILSALLTCLAPLPLYAAPQPLTLAQAQQRALSQVPTLRVNQAEVRTAQGELARARTYPYVPTLDLNTGLRQTEGSSAGTDYGVGLSYELETGNQQSARTARGEAGLVLQTQRLALTQAQVLRNVTVAYTQLWVAERLLALAQQRYAIITQLLDAQREQFKAGKVNQLTVNLAQLEQQRAALEVQSRQGQDQRAEQALRTILAEPPGPMLCVADLPPLPPLPDLKDFLLRTSQTPTLLAAQAEVNQTQADLALAQGRLSPNLTPTLSYRREGLENVVFAGVSLPLTFFNTTNGGVLAATAQIERAQAQVAVLNNALNGQIQEAYLSQQTAQQATTLHRDLVTASEQNFTLLQTAFRFGKINLFELLLAQRDALRVQDDLVQSQAAALIAAADLKNALGEIQ